MRETALYGRLRPKLAEWGSVDRVENAIGPGMWDIHYCVEGRVGWVETKLEHGGELKFERFQLSWARRHVRAGATSLYLIYGPGGSDVMHVCGTYSLLNAPLSTKGKWTVVRVEDLDPVLTMSKPYNWGDLRQLLSTGRV